MNAARENDGKFGTQQHGAPDGVSLTVHERPEWLNGWPESLPVPELSFHMGDDNVIITTASINGETFVEAWNPGDDVYSQESHAFDLGIGTEDETEAAEEWIRGRHEQIAADLRTEMHNAVERARHHVMAKVTGTVAPVSNDELQSVVNNCSVVLDQAQKDMELAATALVARGALEDHPTAASIVLDTDEVDDEGEVVTGFTVRDADGTLLADYDASETGWAGYAASLSASNGWWTNYTPKTYQTEDDGYTIDLKAAAAWAPGQN